MQDTLEALAVLRIRWAAAAFDDPFDDILGQLKRGLGEHLVVAPYASALAMMVAPREASRNLAWLEQQGYLSPHGFYDAIDFTPARPGAPLQPVPCRTVMVHHSGMTLLALDNALLDGPMPRRFLKTPACAAHDLLLPERMPRPSAPFPTTNDETTLLIGYSVSRPFCATPASTAARILR